MNDTNKTTPKPTGATQDTNDTKNRTGGFPTLSLQKALSLIQKVWEKEKRNPAPAAAIVEHWGYAAKSSGGFQALASLKRFGLLEEAAGAAQRTLKLTSLSLELLKTESTHPIEYRKLLKTVALTPDLHKAMWNKYAHELPSDKTIESHLVFDLHFSEESASQFIRLYKETISFAKLSENDSIQEPETIKSEIEEEQSIIHPKAQKLESVSTPKNIATDIPNISGELSFSIAGKVVRVPFPMSEEEFDLFIGTLNLWKKKLIKTFSVVPPAVKLPAHAVWKNNDTGKPVKIIAVMGERNGELYYQSEDGTGIPVSQLKFS